MLQAGYVFCHRCGHATQEAYYFNSMLNSWVQLVRKVTGKFSVQKYTPAYMENRSSGVDADVIKRVRLSATNTSNVQGLQHTISVECYVDQTMQVLEFVRSCPFCVGQKEGWDSAVELLPNMGDLPTYVVGVVGARTVGKSCWIHALSCPTNVNGVNNQGNNLRSYSGYTLSTARWSNEQSAIISATELNERGITRMMRILKRVGNGAQPVAQVLMMDFAGELFAEDKKEEFESSAAHIFRGGEGYSGVDGVVFMMDPLPEQNGYSLATTYHKPIAFVMNKADLLIENPPMYHIDNDENNPAVPLLTEHTFSRQGGDMYQKSVLQARVALQTMLLKRIHPLVKSISNETRCGGFILKSTEPYSIKNAETMAEEKMLDFSQGMNVMDPLLWILNELDIFPIED